MNPEVTYEDRVLGEKEVSAWLGVSLPNLQRMRSSGSGPRYVQLSARRIGYRKSAVEAWLTSRTIDRIGTLIVPPRSHAGPAEEERSWIG